MLKPKIYFYSFLLFFIMFNTAMFPQGFKKDQKRYSRVREAYSSKYELLKKELSHKDFAIDSLQLFIRGLKLERKLEVWAKNINDRQFRLFKTYDFCSFSGSLGPKRVQGDGQIPEGFYYISHFNPYSNFYLSLKVSYPNKSDRILGGKDPGGDIFIHGNCVTIGCIPITDDLIKELYVLCVEAKNAGQTNIPVHIFPTKLNSQGKSALKEEIADEASKIFWTWLEPGYLYFEKNKQLPAIKVGKSGKYIF